MSEKKTIIRRTKKVTPTETFVNTTPIPIPIPTPTIPVFSKLYKEKDNSKIYVWEIEIKENPTIPLALDIITKNGYSDGKKATHVSTISEGKASRSVLQQATLEATRKYKDKLEKELYKPIDNTISLNVENNSVSELSVDNLRIHNEITPKIAGDDKVDEKHHTNHTNHTKTAVTKTTLKKAAAVSRIVVRPMLAQQFKFDLYNASTKGKKFKIELPFFVQRKFDGIRCIAYFDENNDKVVLESRTGTTFENFNIIERVLYDFLKQHPSIHLDGELYTDKIPFETISGLVRSSSKHLNASDIPRINMIEYFIYDMYDQNFPELSFDIRNQFLNTNFHEISQNSPNINLVETVTVTDIHQVKQYHDQYVQEGYEGIMRRATDGPYEVNKRSKYLQKFKEFLEEEFRIVGFTEGTGIETGLVLWTCETNDKKQFNVRPKGNHDYRRKMFLHGNDYIGKNLTVIFQEYTTDKIPRFGVGKAIRENY